MAEFIYRTEEMTTEQIHKLYVSSSIELDIIKKLKSATPILLEGSRGVGKSFLFRVAESELNNSFNTEKILPVFITLRKAALIHAGNPNKFHAWMLSKICSELYRALKKRGIYSVINSSIGLLIGSPIQHEKTPLEELTEKFESSWKNPGNFIDEGSLPSLDDFLNTIEDICGEHDIKRIVLFIDEAAHVFYPQQQREFFTLFRDLRSAYIKCNAAVYPGVTVYGDTFEPLHDATKISLNRSVTDSDYIEIMKQMVLNQVSDSSVAVTLSRRGEFFSVLAYAAGGNPRHLLKTVEMAGGFDSATVNKVLREYYRESIWGEHSGLAIKYPGYTKIIDWGRDFIENEVIPEIKSKNDRSIEVKGEESATSAFFWIHRNAPQEVKEALRLLEYTGIIAEHSSGIRATRSEVGSRYIINLGCIFAQEATPTSSAFSIAKRLSIKRMTEYGSNYKSFDSIKGSIITDQETELLTVQLEKSIETLDMTAWQKCKLHELEIHTIGALIEVEESKLKEARYVSDMRARQMKNAAVAAVYEYLLG